MIDKKKLRKKLGIYSYGDACGFVACIFFVTIAIVLSCLDPLALAIFTSIFAIIAVVCFLGYLIHKLLN